MAEINWSCEICIMHNYSHHVCVGEYIVVKLELVTGFLCLDYSFFVMQLSNLLKFSGKQGSNGYFHVVLVR